MNIINFTEGKKRIEDAKAQEMVDKFDSLVREQEDIEADIKSFSVALAGDIVYSIMEETDLDPSVNPDCVLDLFAMIQTIQGFMCRINSIPHKYHSVADVLGNEDDTKEYRSEILANFIEAFVVSEG